MLLVQTISKSIKSLAQRYHRLRLRYLALHRENYHLKTQCSKMKEATKDADDPSAIVIAQSIIRHTDKDDSGGVVGTPHQQCNLSNDQRGQLAHLSHQTSVSPPKSLLSGHAKRGPSVSPRGGLYILSEASARLSEADDLVTKNLGQTTSGEEFHNHASWYLRLD